MLIFYSMVNRINWRDFDFFIFAECCGKIIVSVTLQAVDWWGTGVVTYELLTGLSPFSVEEEIDYKQRVRW
jgi:serine/threonine protein kinase